MGKLYKNTHGFAVSESLLISAAVIFMVASGWLVYNHYDKSNAALVLQRQQYIDKYISGITLRNYASFGSSLNNRGYLTTSLYSTTQSLINGYTDGSFDSNPAYSKIICVDEIPSYYTYGAVNVSSSGNTATITVKVFTAGSVTPTPYTAYWVNTDGTWQLNNVQC
jgi:hypothetical protein